MVKTVPFDIPASFIIGMLIALASAPGLKASTRVAGNRFFMAAVLFELFFFLPLGAYLYFFYPGWSLMYFIDPASYGQDTLVSIGLVALGCYMLSAMAGFVLAAWMIRADREKAARIVFLAVIAALAVFSLFTLDRLMQVGTFAQWSAPIRETSFIWSHRVGWIVGLDSAVATAMLAWLIRSLRAEGHSP